jgi:uridylate kinase
MQQEPTKKEYIVISLGGSLIVPDEIDVEFLKQFSAFIKDCVAQGFRFAIVTGGGKLARKYNTATESLTSPSTEDLDWLGIAATRVNAEFVRIILGDLTHGSIVMDPDQVPHTDKPILVGGGWKPGNSSDLAAIHMAQSLHAQKVINLSNIDYAYDKDPHKYPDAQKIISISWKDFRLLLPVEWTPGLSAPFDPIAAQKAESLGIEVAIMNGRNIDNLKKYLNGEEFAGTVIK